MILRSKTLVIVPFVRWFSPAPGAALWRVGRRMPWPRGASLESLRSVVMGLYQKLFDLGHTLTLKRRFRSLSRRSAPRVNC